MFDDHICNNIENMQMPGIREHPWVGLTNFVFHNSWMREGLEMKL